MDDVEKDGRNDEEMNDDERNIQHPSSCCWLFLKL